MPDITMCVNVECPLADSCYRVKAKPSDYQSWSFFNYKVTAKGIECSNFLEIYRHEVKSQ
jgi:hypothetical protein